MKIGKKYVEILADTGLGFGYFGAIWLGFGLFWGNLAWPKSSMLG